MEAGENPARSRHCKEGVLSEKPLGREIPGRQAVH